MEQRKVTLERQISEYLSDLIIVLLKENYFSFYEEAEKYVEFIHHEIVTNIHKVKHYPVPSQNKKLGDYYCIIKTNKRTA